MRSHMEDHTFLAFRPGLRHALTIKDVTDMLEELERRDVMAGGMMCSKGHRITPVVCTTRTSHFRHVPIAINSEDGTSVVQISCSCSKTRVHSEALQMLRDHDYAQNAIRFVQWYECNIHFATVYTATSEVYPVLEVTEWSKNGRKRFRSDLVYRRRVDDGIDQRIEGWHTHRTRPDGARADIIFLEADTTHIRESLLRGEYTLRVETMHAKECPECAEIRRQEVERRRLDEAKRRRLDEEHRHRLELMLEQEETRRRLYEKKRVQSLRQRMVRAFRVIWVAITFRKFMRERLARRTPMWTRIKKQFARLHALAKRNLARKRKTAALIVQKWQHLVALRHEYMRKLRTKHSKLRRHIREWIDRARVNERVTYDLKNPDKTARRAHAMRLYEKWDKYIESRDLSYKWRDKGTMTGAERQKDFEKWNITLLRAIEVTKAKRVETNARNKVNSERKREPIPAPEAPAPTRQKVSEIELDITQRRMDSIAERRRAYRPSYIAPPLAGEEDPASIVSREEEQLQMIEEQFENKRTRLQEKINFHASARLEAVPYSQKGTTRFWKNSSGGKIMYLNSRKKVEAICTPTGCQECDRCRHDLDLLLQSFRP